MLLHVHPWKQSADLFISENKEREKTKQETQIPSLSFYMVKQMPFY